MINERYNIVKLLGEGRSKVFLCEDAFNESKICAIKIISYTRETEELEAFTNEFRTLKRMSHPSIVSVLDYGIICDLNEDELEIFGVSCKDHFFVLEYFTGTELTGAAELKDEAFLIVILEQICSVLYYLHQSNYIYFDLKPENILVGSKDGLPLIKFIDFGFARHIPSVQDYGIKGTAEYIAPEILKKGAVDQRSDLYSLGIMIYKIAYGKFPFNCSSEVELYKAQIHQEPEFPSCSFSDKIIGITKKLLAKNPDERFKNTIQILLELGVPLDDRITNHWKISEAFTGRNSQQLFVKNYISASNNGEILKLIGEEGAGKTNFLSQIESIYKDVIFVDCSKANYSVELWKYLLNKIIYNCSIYEKVDKAILRYVQKNLIADSNDLLTELKSIIARISYSNKFVLILDNVDFQNQFTNELLLNLIPILQANGVKIIITENNTDSSEPVEFPNQSKLSFDVLSEEEIDELVESSIAEFFPKKKLKELIIDHSDRLPGNVINFISDLFLLKVIQFNGDGAYINHDNAALSVLKDYRSNIFQIRLGKLDETERKIVKLLSLFSHPLPFEALLKLSGIDEIIFSKKLQRLKDNNVLKNIPSAAAIQFATDSLRSFVYHEINYAAELHSSAADQLMINPCGVTEMEIADQFEKASRFKDSYKLMVNEIKKAENMSALSYKEHLLQRLVSYPLPENVIMPLKLELCKTHTKLGKYHSASEILSQADFSKLEESMRSIVNIENGIITKRLGNIKEGVSILRNEISNIPDINAKGDLLLEVADGELDLNNYSEVFTICDSLVNSGDSSHENVGKAYNLLGLAEYYGNSNLAGSITYFNKSLSAYQLAKKMDKVAGMELNVGNIYYMNGDHTKAEIHWNKALQINQSIGNVEQEALTLLSYGILMNDKLNFEDALAQYKRAYEIFRGIGNTHNLGIALMNMGESNTIICEYAEAEKCFNEATSIFKESVNYEEMCETLFLYAKLKYALNNRTKLNEIKDKLKASSEKLAESTKVQARINFVNFLCSVLSGTNLPSREEIIQLSEEFNKLNYNATASEILLNYAGYQLKRGLVDDAFTVINYNALISFSEKNKHFAAWRELLLGIISETEAIQNIKSPVDYYTKAMQKVEELSIFEITWQIMFALAKYFISRGNKNKSEQYVVYTKKLIFRIADNLPNPEIRNEYLSESSRKETLEFLENID